MRNINIQRNDTYRDRYRSFEYFSFIFAFYQELVEFLTYMNTPTKAERERERKNQRVRLGERSKTKEVSLSRSVNAVRYFVN